MVPHASAAAEQTAEAVAAPTGPGPVSPQGPGKGSGGGCGGGGGADPAPRQQQQQQQQQQRQQQRSRQDEGAPGEAWRTRVLPVDPSLLEAAAAAPAERYLLPQLLAGGEPSCQQQQQQQQQGQQGQQQQGQQAQQHEQREQQHQQQQTHAPLAAALAALSEAGALLRAGHLVGLPTETVYGLAASALDAAAAARIFEAKGRPGDNPLIVHISDLEMLRALYPGVDDPVPRAYTAAVAAHWPGPLTILLPASPLVPPIVTAGHPTMAVRMPSHPVARAAIAAAGVPLAAPSANSSGRPSPTLACHVTADLAGRLPLVLDGGPCGCGVESTVLDALRAPPAVLRPGGVPAEALAPLPGLAGLQVYSREFTDAALEAAPTTPGMKYRHYSPDVPVLLVEPPPVEVAALAGPPRLGPPLVARGGAAEEEQQQEEEEQRQQQQQQQQQQQEEQQPNGVGAPAPSVGASPSQAAGWRPAAAALRAAADAAVAELLADGRRRVAVLRTSLPDSTPPGWVAGEGPWGGGGSNGGGGACVQPAAAAAGGGGPAEAASAAVAVREYCLGPMARPSEVARALFAALRDAEAGGAEAIVVEGVPEAGEGLAVMNRLRKAASAVRRAAAGPGTGGAAGA